MRVSDQSGAGSLRIRTFGEVTIELPSTSPAGVAVGKPGSVRVRFATRTVDALLIYLACHIRPLGRDVLAELFWPERTQKQARSNLRVALHRLRQQLAPYVLVTRHSVALNPDSAIRLDVAQFEAHLAAGRLEEAAALYTNDFLDGFYLDGSPAFEQWALLERERLRTLALAACQQLSSQRAAAGQVTGAIAIAQRLLQLDPLHEPTHRQLMRLLAQADQRSAALAQYETCRHLLATELGAAPDDTTTALFEQIRTKGFGPRVAAGATTSTQFSAQAANDDQEARTHATKSHNLPLQPTRLIGRRAELAQIESLLANPDCRLLTLLGVGGIGKTRLALEAAQRVSAATTVAPSDPGSQIQPARFAGGVCFVALASVETTEFMFAAIAQSLDIQVTGSNLLAEITAHLRERTLLLLLDNFEHLLDAAGSIAHLLQNASRVKIVVTSRARLHLREEWLLPISGLALAEGLLGEAGQLFVRSAQRVHPTFTGRGQEEAIAAVCAQVEGMPLALELAASWVRVMPCTEIARHIQQNFDFLSTELRNLPERHRSMRALFDQSWRLLSPLEQGVLMRLSVFQGGWLCEDAAPVTGATLAILLGLVDKSLVHASGQNRFDLHELVCQYAAEKLVASGEADLIRERHYGAYLHLFRIGDSHLRGPEVATWFARLAAEQDNLRAALQWSLDGGRYEDAAWLLVAAWWFLHFRGQWFESGRWHLQLLPHRQILSPSLRLTILLYVYSIARALDEFQPYDQWTGEIMALLEVCPDKLQHAAVWHFTAEYAEDLPQAAAAWERSIALAHAAQEAPGLGREFGLVTDRDFILGHSLRSYASRLTEHGEFAQARSLLRESLEIAQARGSRYEIVDSLGALGRLALLQGDLAAAHTLLHEAVMIAADFGYQEMLCFLQPFLGLVTLYQGKLAEARRLLRESLRLCIDLRHKVFLARVCTYLAEAALCAGEIEEAAHWLRQGLAYDADPRRTGIDQVERLFVAARVATAQANYPAAATLFGLAERVRQGIHYELGEPVRLPVAAALAAVGAALDPPRFAASFSAGQQLSLDEGFHTMLGPRSGK